MYTLFLFLLVLITTAEPQEEDYFEQRIKDEVEMAGLELRDDCENFSKAYKLSLITNDFSEKMKVQEAHGLLVRGLAKNLRQFEDDISEELRRNWTLFTKPGDELLDDQDWSALISYGTGNEEFTRTLKVHCNNGTKNCVFIKKGYETLLETSKNDTLLKKSWSAWQALLSSRQQQFPNILNLIKKAAPLNDKEDAKSYWEMLVEGEDAYSIADGCWERIRPLYFKLQDFVRRRLFHFYNIESENAEIPAYFLGSNFGDDWSHIAGTLLPHPQLYSEADKYIKKKSVKEVYEQAEEMTQDLSLGPFGAKFWSDSLFNMTFCENHIISDCVAEDSVLLTCPETSYVSYLDSFETAVDVTLRNKNYIALSQMSLRYSVIDESLKSIGSVLAIKNLRYKGIWDADLFAANSSGSRPNEMAELLLIALRILPKLPYYLAADQARLQVLENGGDFTEKWWELRKEYQGVSGVTGSEPDFLGDSHVTSNRPYLSKFLGTVLAFQFLTYYRDNWNPNESIAPSFGNDENFRAMIRDRSVDDWSSLLSTYYAIYEISADALFEYFSPLEDYLDSAPLEQVVITTPATTTSQSTPAPPTSTVVPVHHDQISPKSLLPNKNSSKIHEDENFDPPLHPRHEHVEENLEGPNPTMEGISMYVGISLLVAVAAIIVYVVVTKEMRKRKRTNNRRFET